MANEDEKGRGKLSLTDDVGATSEIESLKQQLATATNGLAVSRSQLDDLRMENKKLLDRTLQLELGLRTFAAESNWARSGIAYTWVAPSNPMEFATGALKVQ